MNHETFEEISRLRHEIAQFRDLTKARKRQCQELNARPIGARDAVEHLRLRCRISEYELKIKERQERIRELRKQSFEIAQQRRKVACQNALKI